MTNETTGISNNGPTSSSAVATCNPVTLSPKNSGTGAPTDGQVIGNSGAVAALSVNAVTSVASTVSAPSTTTTSNVNVNASNVANSFTDEVNEDDAADDDKVSPGSSSPAAEEEPDQPPSVEATQIEATE